MLQNTDLVQVNVRASGNGQQVSITKAFTVGELGIQAQAAPAGPAPVLGTEYSKLLAKARDSADQAERAALIEKANLLMADFQAAAGAFVGQGGAVTDGQSIATALCDYLVEKGIDGHKFSRTDAANALRISEKELTVTGPVTTQVGGNAVRIFHVAAAAVWG